MNLIDELQQRSYSICMCGDGANDCEALRHANVGIALSKCQYIICLNFIFSPLFFWKNAEVTLLEKVIIAIQLSYKISYAFRLPYNHSFFTSAPYSLSNLPFLGEASLAAPFTSSVFNITCVPVLLKEGQAALENAMAVFRFTAMYSIIQYVSVLLLIHYESILGDYQYLLEDLAIVLLFDFALGYTKPSKILSRVRPRGSLMHPFTVFSFIMQTTLVVGFIVLSMWLVQQQAWYDPFRLIRVEHWAEGELYVPYFETTVNFIHSSFQYIIIALVFSIGHPHRRPLYTNIPMLVSIVLTAGILLLVLFISPKKIPLLELANIPDISYKLLMLGLVVVNLLLSLGVEYSYRVIEPLQRFLKMLRFKKGHKNKFKCLIDELEAADTKWPQLVENGIWDV